jgi:hypothetical protein
MVDRRVEAQLFQKVAALPLASSNPHHPAAPKPGDLPHNRAHGARCRADHQRLSRPGLPYGLEPNPGCMPVMRRTPSAVVTGATSGSSRRSSLPSLTE